MPIGISRQAADGTLQGHRFAGLEESLSHGLHALILKASVVIEAIHDLLVALQELLFIDRVWDQMGAIDQNIVLLMLRAFGKATA